MFTCISSKKQFSDEEGEEGHESGSSRVSSSKSLTAQIKDIVLKVSDSLHLKAFTGSSPTIEGVQHPYVADASAPSTPGWAYEGFHQPRETCDPRFVEGSTGSRSPRKDDDPSTSTVEFPGFQTSRHDSSIFMGDFPGFHTTRHASTSVSEIVEEEEEEFREWVAEVEDGVHITFRTIPNGENILVRIRFSQGMFDRLQAQRWWVDNYDRINELYNIRRVNRQNLYITPPPTEREIEEENSREDDQHPTLANIQDSSMSISFREWAQGRYPTEPSNLSGGATSSSSIKAANTNIVVEYGDATRNDNDVEVEAEWENQDEPGVFIKVRQLVDGKRELQHIRFSSIMKMLEFGGKGTGRGFMHNTFESACSRSVEALIMFLGVEVIGMDDEIDSWIISQT